MKGKGNTKGGGVIVLIRNKGVHGVVLEGFFCNVCIDWEL